MENSWKNLMEGYVTTFYLFNVCYIEQGSKHKGFGFFMYKALESFKARMLESLAL